MTFPGKIRRLKRALLVAIEKALRKTGFYEHEILRIVATIWEAIRKWK